MRPGQNMTQFMLLLNSLFNASYKPEVKLEIGAQGVPYGKSITRYMRKVIRKFIEFLGNMWEIFSCNNPDLILLAGAPHGEYWQSPRSKLSASPPPIIHNLRLFGSGAGKRGESISWRHKSVSVISSHGHTSCPFAKLAAVYWRWFFFTGRSKVVKDFSLGNYLKKCYFKLVAAPNVEFYTWW